MRKPYGLLFGVVDSSATVGMTTSKLGDCRVEGDGCRFLRYGMTTSRLGDCWVEGDGWWRFTSNEGIF
ncbi:MAG: hypothetical protein KJ674_05605 [Nanoarchaeota archaeon]|nr:hypothetical protein [Nanoarchaeota archaeon]